jgi:cell cycle related kinase
VNELPDYHKVAFPDMPPQDLARVFPRVPRKGLALFGRLLSLDPERRPTAEEALSDCWFFVDPWMCERRELVVVGREVPLKLRGVLREQGRMGKKAEDELWEGLG